MMTGRITVVLMAIGLCAGAAAADITVTGDVNPTDPALWPTTTLTIGDTGVGSVTIDDDSDAVSTWGHIGSESGSTGSATVSGVGSTWLSNGGLTVGYNGSATMDILAGGYVESLRGWVGSHPSSNGLATVDGSGSTWTISYYLLVGGMGVGTLDITNGGTVSGAREGWIGHWVDSTGAVTVDGVGSTWSAVEHTVGGEGNATLDITNGGAVTTDGTDRGARIAAGATSIAVVTISGAGSTWAESGVGFTAGGLGDATLNIDTGGSLSSTWGRIAWRSGSTGVVTIDGDGSTWHSAGLLTVGDEGAGTLAITNGGLTTVGADGMTIDSDGDGNSFVNMGGGGMLALYGQADDSLASFLGLIDGTDAIRYWDSVPGDWRALTDATYGEDYTLSYLTEGDLDGYTVLTVYPTAGPLGDFDGDGDVDVDDIGALIDNIGDPAYDLDGDLDADEDDLIYMIEDLVQWSRPGGDSGVGTKRGDANLDGLVSATDLAIMKANFAQTGIGWSGANLNVDDIVNGIDLAILKANFAFVAPTGAVPEPMTLLVMAAAGLPLLLKRKRKSRA